MELSTFKFPTYPFSPSSKERKNYRSMAITILSYSEFLGSLYPTFIPVTYYNSKNIAEILLKAHDGNFTNWPMLQLGLKSLSYAGTRYMIKNLDFLAQIAEARPQLLESLEAEKIKIGVSLRISKANLYECVLKFWL